MDSPCRGCPERNAECHGVCDRYKKYKHDYAAQQAEEKAKRRVQKALDAYELETIRRNYVAKWKNKRKKGV